MSEAKNNLQSDRRGPVLWLTIDRPARRNALNGVVFDEYSALIPLLKQWYQRRVLESGFKIRLNAIAIKGLTESEVLPLAYFARERDMELRFIEFMPLDADQQWQEQDVLSGAKIREILTSEFGSLVTADRADQSQPAVDYEFADGKGKIGLINSVTEPFCKTCNRLRLTAEGGVRNCLFSDSEWDARAVMRDGGDDNQLLQLVRDCLASKKTRPR